MASKPRTRSPIETTTEEWAVISGCLLDPRRIPRVLRQVHPEEFADARHQVVMECLQDCADSGHPVTRAALIDRLKSTGKWEFVGGAKHLADYDQYAPDPASLDHKAALIRKRAVTRQYLAELQAAIEQVQDSNNEPGNLMDNHLSVLLALQRRASAQTAGSPLQAGEKAFMEMYYESIEGQQPKRIYTGLDQVDKNLGGFNYGTLNVVGARPGTGKSAFLLQIAIHNSLAGNKVLFCGGEMTTEETIARVIANRCHVDSKFLMDRRIDDEGSWAQYATVLSQILRGKVSATQNTGGRLGLSCCVTPFSCEAIRNRALAFRDEAEGLDLLIVDYLQQLKPPPGRYASMNEQVEAKSAYCLALAQELNVVVLCASQLSRPAKSTYKPKGEHPDQQPRPTMEDLRGSGAIEQDVHRLLLLWARPGAVSESLDYERQVLINPKNRMGKKGAGQDVDLIYRGPYNLYAEASIFNTNPINARQEEMY